MLAVGLVGKEFTFLTGVFCCRRPRGSGAVAQLVLLRIYKKRARSRRENRIPNFGSSSVRRARVYSSTKWISIQVYIYAFSIFVTAYGVSNFFSPPTFSLSLSRARSLGTLRAIYVPFVARPGYCAENLSLPLSLFHLLSRETWKRECF